MERLKTFLFQRFRTIFAITTLTGLSLLLLMLRLKLTHSYFLLFLTWNLFLAAIPFLITFYLSSRKKAHRYRLLLWLGLWLLFLPNAPYIVTDFIHLQHLQANIVWLDNILIATYAASGLLFYFISVKDMEELLHRHFQHKKVKYMLWTIPFLAGFGIYLGRFLRWNSWDIIQRPHFLIRDVGEIIVFPLQHKVAWLVTLLFGCGLALGYRMFKKIPFFKLKKYP
ncbi:MAG: DUF1361 domain-containing protein [Bacteroidota bacterium]